MTAYVIHGQYPTYTVVVDGEEINHASNMASLMKWFTHTLEPGDSILWAES